VSVAGLAKIAVMVVRAAPRRVERPVLVPGVLGSSYRAVRPQVLPFAVGDLALLHTDGVRARLEPDSWSGLSAQSTVDSVLNAHARRGDDAGCIVARGVVARQASTPSPSLRPLAAAQREIPVQSRSDADCAAQEARRFAETVGLGARAQWEVSIATSELATNIAKHAGRGLIRLGLEPGPEAVLVVEAIDSGGGIADVGAALTDGYSEGGLRSERPRTLGEGLGVGLGSVRRMMDQVHVQTHGAHGTRVIAKKRLSPER
jgi:serine/threonine-protein kinase RsbT